jgi:rod shape-determining protein MreD
MSVAGQFAPIVSVFLLALIAVLPWGLPPDARFVLPLLPVIAILHWATADRTRLSPIVAFSAGLGVDILTSGPLGYWSLIYLVGLALAPRIQNVAEQHGRWARFFGVINVLFLLITLAWTIASFFYLELADWRPFAWAGILACALYPPLVFFLGLFERQGPRRLNDTLTRGR